jgi:transposase InsO family protein
LPKRTALYNYLRPFLPRLNDAGRVRTKRPNPEPERTQQVHQRWQMDFKGNVRLADGSQVAPWLTCDEHSSAPLAAQLYSTHRGDPRQGLTFRDIQADLRAAFTQWGRPQQLRMDRDPLWVGSTRMEWPGTVLLWLVGLGIQPIVNPPGKPTDNAQIERLNRTWNQHVYRGQETLDPQALQQATDQAWQDRRQALPSNNRHCRRRPPLVAFPELLTAERPFHPDLETKVFEMERVYAYLSEWQWERKVDKTGSISVADFNRLVSRDHYRQIVKVRFDPQEKVFRAAAVDEHPLATFTLPIIAPDYILGGRNR